MAVPGRHYVSAAERAHKLCTENSVSISQENLEEWGLSGVQLRPYQLKGVSWLAERFASGYGCILGDEMGLGKTLQSISLLVYFHKQLKNPGPFLILVPLSVIRNWELELSRFAPHFTVLNYSGGKEEREEQRKEIGSGRDREWKKEGFPFHIMLAHYEVVIKDASFLQKFPWQCLIVDEGHRLKNSSSILYKLLKEFQVKFSMLLTGTPVQNNLHELYSLLSFVNSNIFPLSKSEDFLGTFAHIKDKEDSSSLHTILKPFLLRRIKDEVLLDLPGKSEVILYTGMSATQRKLYKGLLTKDLAAFGEGGGKTRLMNILVQLRKCVNHPYLFDGVEPEPFEMGEHLVEASGKLFLLDKLLSTLKSKGHRVLLFSQMTRMLDIIQDYLGFRDYSYERLDGSVRGEERFLAVKNFTEGEETFIFLLSTRAGGQGLNLAGADTVIFVDSDFNPQNDLQAAARAHRIGQTRPVKVVRLVTRHSVEEIILKRAHSKLELTGIVIEGGQFSHGTAAFSSSSAENSSQLSEVLKFGLDHLLDSEESTLVDEDMESILGPSEGGRWGVSTMATGEQEEKEFQAPENMYVYEGEDYSKPSDADKRTFDQMLADQLKLAEEDEVRDRVLRSERQVPLRDQEGVALPVRKRKPLTAEQLEERRKKREENRAKRMKLMEEKERLKLEAAKKKKLEHWKRNHYESTNISLGSSSSEEEEEEEEVEGVDIKYVIGDVTRPQVTGAFDSLVLHCVDDSGRWGSGGVFSSLSGRSSNPQVYYERAGHMRDLTLGDAHVVPIDDRISREEGRDFLVLMVAQSRSGGGGKGKLSGVKLSALSTCLQRVSLLTRRRKAGVHLARIGYNTPQFNWYGTERLIRKHLSSRGIPCYIYYFKRRSQASRMNPDPYSSATSSAPPTSDLHATPSALLPVGCDPLPDVFKGFVFLFHRKIELEVKKKWTRYILAYDGEVAAEGEEEREEFGNITHMVCDEVEDHPKGMKEDDKMKLVTLQWLERSLQHGSIQP